MGGLSMSGLLGGVSHLLGVTAAATAPTSPTTSLNASPSTPASVGPDLPSVLLSGIIWATTLAASVVCFLPARTTDQRGRIRLVALAGSGFSFLLAFFSFNGQLSLGDAGGGAAAYVESYRWLDSSAITASYHLTADGISLPLLLLSSLIFVCAIFATWKVEVGVRSLCILLLLLETGVNGVLCAGDHLLFILFWGFQIVPLALLLHRGAGVAGRRAVGRYLGAALPSLGLLVIAFLVTTYVSGQRSVDLDVLDSQALPGAAASAAFWLTFAAFGLALAVFPGHLWATDVVEQSGTIVAAVVSGIVIRLGGYGMIRLVFGSFPAATHQFSVVILGLAVACALWGTIGSLAQSSLRGMLGYLTVAQAAPVLLSVAVQSRPALVGAVLQLVAQGLGTALLVFIAGAVEERAKTADPTKMGGLAVQVPRLSVLWIIGALSAVGIPLFAGFSADLLVFTGAFPFHRFVTVVVLGGSLIATVALFRAAGQVFMGPSREAFARVKDATTLELTYLLPLLTGLLLFGGLPGRAIPMISTALQELVAKHASGG